MTPTLRERSIRGLKTAWLEAGDPGPDAPLLLLLHGFPDAADSWSYQIEAFAERCLVVAPYMRGAAPSAAGDRLERYGPDAVALDLMTILADVDPGERRPLVIVGHDLGSVHAWHLARLLQKRVAGLVIINGLTIPQMLKRLTGIRQLSKSWYIWLMQLPLIPEALLKAFPRRLVDHAHARGGLPPERRPELAKVRGALRAPLNQYREFLREAPRRLLNREARLTCPVLVLWGANDAFLMPPTADELAADAVNVLIRILPGNHWLHRSQPEQVNSLIAGVLERSLAGTQASA